MTSFSRFALGTAAQGFSKVRATMRQELAETSADRLKRLVTKFTLPGTNVDPTLTGGA